MSERLASESEAKDMETVLPTHEPETPADDSVTPALVETAAPADTASTPATPGALLAARREELGLSLERVAEQLKMSPRKLQSIEANDHAAVHGKAIFRGFVRAYAKVLKMDPEPLVALLPEDRPNARVLVSTTRHVSGKFAESSFPASSRRAGQNLWVISGIVVLLLLIAFLLAQKMKWIPDMSQIASSWRAPKASAQPSSAAPASASPAVAEKSGEEGKGKIKRIDLPPVDVASQLASAPASAPAPASAASGGEPAVAPTPTKSDNVLILNVREKSWVEIRRANGSVLFEKTIPAGGSESVTIKEPVSVTMGHGAGIDATFRGEPLNTKPEGDSKVVRLNLK